jgi:hypothetical protein
MNRNYSLIKVSQGDYLLPSNDGQTLWRIRRYQDGPSYGLEEWPADRDFWGAWKYTGRIRWRGGLDTEAYEDLIYSDAWDGPVDWQSTTRAEAIAAALRGGAR